jgi:hypothetical protein
MSIIKPNKKKILPLALKCLKIKIASHPHSYKNLAAQDILKADRMSWTNPSQCQKNKRLQDK